MDLKADVENIPQIFGIGYDGNILLGEQVFKICFQTQMNSSYISIRYFKLNGFEHHNIMVWLLFCGCYW